MEVAACYAQAKTVADPWRLHPKPERPLPDYPVIVTLDMDGLVPLADYDAEKLWPDVRDVLREFFRMNPEAEHRHLERWLEGDLHTERRQFARGDSTLDALFRIASWRIEDPYGALRDFVDGYPSANILELLRAMSESDSRPPDEVLCALSDQYRYVEDVEESRIFVVSYMKPFWPDLLDWQEEEHEEGEESDADLAGRLEVAGFSVLDIEDVDRGTAQVAAAAVYSKRSRPKRPEYHGTSYRNLLSAAPRLGKKLPVPPPPFGGAK